MTLMTLRVPPSALLLGLAVASASCSSLQSSDNVLGFITPYRIEVVQGNVVTREQAARVQPGMSREQVRELLGSPLLADVFHADRWDYVFTIRRQGAEPQRRSVVAWFKGDVLTRLDAGELPSERDFVDAISTARPKSVPPLALTEEQRQALPQPRVPAAAERSEPQGPARDYPALEPRT
jgi:outer membrane protein assembly factor BamE